MCVEAATKTMLLDHGLISKEYTSMLTEKLINTEQIYYCIAVEEIFGTQVTEREECGFLFISR